MARRAHRRIPSGGGAMTRLASVRDAAGDDVPCRGRRHHRLQGSRARRSGRSARGDLRGTRSSPVARRRRHRRRLALESRPAVAAARRIATGVDYARFSCRRPARVHSRAAGRTRTSSGGGVLRRSRVPLAALEARAAGFGALLARGRAAGCGAFRRCGARRFVEPGAPGADDRARRSFRPRTSPLARMGRIARFRGAAPKGSSVLSVGARSSSAVDSAAALRNEVSFRRRGPARRRSGSRRPAGRLRRYNCGNDGSTILAASAAAFASIARAPDTTHHRGATPRCARSRAARLSDVTSTTRGRRQRALCAPAPTGVRSRAQAAANSAGLSATTSRAQRAEHHGGHVHREERHVMRRLVADRMPPPGQPDGVAKSPPPGTTTRRNGRRAASVHGPPPRRSTGCRRP